jgi:MFS family permease
MRRRVALLARQTFRSLGVRNFRLFFAGQLISQIGNWLTLLAMALLVLKLTNRGVAVGLLTGCQFAPVLLLGPWAGLIADRSRKRRLLLASNSVGMAQSCGLAALAFLHHPPVGALYALAAVGGIATAFDSPARRSFVNELVGGDDVPNAVSLNTAMMTGSRVVGAALAGLLITTVGYGWAFVVDAVSYVAVLVALSRIDDSALRAGPIAVRGRGQVRDGLRYVRSEAVLWVPLVMTAIAGTLTYNFSVVFPLFVKRTLHGDDAAFTLLFATMCVGSVLAALVSARRTSVNLRRVVVACAGFGVSMLLMSAMPNLASAFAVAAVVGFASVTFLTASTAILQLRADPAMRGRVLALQAMVFLGSTPIGGPILGAICDTLGVRAGLIVGGMAALVAATWGATQLPAADAEADGSPQPLVGAVGGLLGAD